LKHFLDWIAQRLSSLAARELTVLQQALETPQGATGKKTAPLAVNVQRLVRRFLPIDSLLARN